MKDKVVLLDFDGVYRTQDFYRDHYHQWISTDDLIGTNSYCDKCAQQCLKEKLKEILEPKLTFIGSGNYHYVSLFLTRKIEEDFTLILFDNHSDAQVPVFEELLSCGGWIRTALLTEPHLKQIILVGINEHSISTIDRDIKDEIMTFPYGIICENNDWDISLAKEIKYPAYISVDKDVFSKRHAVTNWDQGDMTMEDFLKGFEAIANTTKIIGMDVCGEYSMDYRMPNLFEEANLKNNRINKELMELGNEVII